jgi:HK97 family phage major capsid protein
MAITFTGYTDLTEANGWIPEPTDNNPLFRDVEVSAVEAVARKVNMTSRTVSVPRFVANGVDVVAEHNDIPLKEATLDEVVLTAIKFADRFAISVEDQQDAVVDSLNAFKREWISNFNIALDHAALGVVGAANGGTRPYTSVYQAVGSGNRSATAGSLTYEDLVEAIGEMETNRKGGLVVIAHPAFKMSLRNLKDADGDRVVADPFGAGVPTVFGHEVYFSRGAYTGTVTSDNPTGGNPLLIVANKSNLILGVRSGPESQVSDQPQWVSDHVELKMRARRAFALADADAARVVELTAAP